MSKNLPSIEDLLADKDNEESTPSRLKGRLDEIRVKEREEEIKSIAAKKDIPYINLIGFAIGPDAFHLIPLETCERLQVVCFLILEGNARFGAVHPENLEVRKMIDEVGKKHHVKTEIYIISEHSLDSALDKYRRLPKVREKTEGVEISEEYINQFTKDIKGFKDVQEKLKEVSTTHILTLLIAAAVKMRASDVHLEPEEKGVSVRFRIDGILHDIARLEKERQKLLTSRIKLLSGLKLNVVDRPQDGRFTIHLAKDDIDVRSSALPTNHGEAITLRLLTATLTGLKLEELGFNKEAYAFIEKEIKKPNGMIISTGPTGSGKTTSLYAVMNKLNNPETKIITIEDPIEYRLKGVSQSQVNQKRDYTFAKGLKSLVRQDPDVLLVGEIRDKETADIAIQAALTGHLLLTTLHTNDSAGAIARLLALGSKPFLLAPALNLVIGQRLVRKLCEHCKKVSKPTEEEEGKLQVLADEWPQNSRFKAPDISKTKFYTAPGCKQCNNFGYFGRTGVFEMFLATKDVKDAIISEKSAAHQLNPLAQKQGMLSLAQDGVLKAAAGITSLEEVFRVAG